MSDYPISISFVSGKGGVGKTALATNFAFVCSKLAKTIIVDLDFQNQGCTGLFTPFTELGYDNAIDSIINIESIDSIRPTQIETNIFFLPAVSPGQHLDLEKVKKLMEGSQILDNLSRFLRHLKVKEGFDIVILDCHGGLDHVSYAAFNFSDYVLVITEADTVTFSGTLELLKYYDTKLNELNNLGDTREDFDRQRSQRSLKFIVNRLQGKYKSEYLDIIYGKYLLNNNSQFQSSQDKSIFCYIPSEEIFANYFGQYPFFVKLDLNSIFSQKIHYMVYKLLSPHFDINSLQYKPLKRYKSSSLRKKNEKLNVSFEALLRTNILWFFTWFSIFMICSFLISVISFFLLQELSNIASDLFLLLPSLLVLFFIPCFFYFSKSMWRVTNLYGRQYNIERRLSILLNNKLSIYLDFFFLRLIFLRFMTAIIIIFGILYFLVLPFSLLWELYQSLTIR